MKIPKKQLHKLIEAKIEAAGLTKEHAEIVSDVLTFADARGIHSHGAVRVEYYSERIAKGGITNHPEFSFKKQLRVVVCLKLIMVPATLLQSWRWMRQSKWLKKQV